MTLTSTSYQMVNLLKFTWNILALNATGSCEHREKLVSSTSPTVSHFREFKNRFWKQKRAMFEFLENDVLFI